MPPLAATPMTNLQAASPDNILKFNLATCCTVPTPTFHFWCGYSLAHVIFLSLIFDEKKLEQNVQQSKHVPKTIRDEYYITVP